MKTLEYQLEYRVCRDRQRIFCGRVRKMFSSRIFTRKKEKKSKLEELYDTYGSFIYYTALKYLGDGHLAQDCTQQSMERLMKYADRLGETEAKETKSYTAIGPTVSTALNMKKQQDRYVAKEDEELIYLVDSASQMSDEIERVLRGSRQP